jgi:hypothetical protein
MEVAVAGRLIAIPGTKCVRMNQTFTVERALSG